MRARLGRGAGLLLVIPVAVGVIGALLGAGPTDAAPAPSQTSGSGPVTVIIPGSASPSPSQSGGGNGGSGGGGSNGGGGGGSNGGGGGAETCTLNADGSPLAAENPKADAPKLKFEKTAVEAGDWAMATATGYDAGEKAQLVLYPGKSVLGSFVAANDGSFTAQFRIPAETRTGGATVEVTGWESCHIANGALTIVSASIPANWLSLWWVWIVLAILAIALVSMAIAFRAEIAGWFGTPRGAGA